MILILLDNGGTLINDPFPAVLKGLQKSWEINESCILQSFTKESFSAFLDLWQKENAIVNFPFASHFLQEERWIISALEKLSRTSLDHSEIPILSPLILTMYRKRARAVIESQPQLSSIRAALKALKAMGTVCIAVASNDRDFATRAMLEWAGLNCLLDAVVTSEMLSVEGSVIEKPNPEFFHRAEETIARQLSISSFERKIYVGDDERNDIVVPNSLGYVTIRYFSSIDSSMNTWIDNQPATAATASYRSAAELLETLQLALRS